MSGLLLLVAGRLRLGFLSDFMSRSVLAGFLTGVGIQIAIGQLDGMLGVHGSGDTTFRQLVTPSATSPTPTCGTSACRPPSSSPSWVWAGSRRVCPGR